MFKWIIPEKVRSLICVKRFPSRSRDCNFVPDGNFGMRCNKFLFRTRILRFLSFSKTSSLITRREELLIPRCSRYGSPSKLCGYIWVILLLVKKRLFMYKGRPLGIFRRFLSLHVVLYNLGTHLHSLGQHSDIATVHERMQSINMVTAWTHSSMVCFFCSCICEKEKLI